jgi:hypothetical protein
VNTKKVLGRKIVAVEQAVEFLGRGRGTANVVRALVLDNGVRLVPVTIETDFGEYRHEFKVLKEDVDG